MGTSTTSLPRRIGLGFGALAAIATTAVVPAGPSAAVPAEPAEPQVVDAAPAQRNPFAPLVPIEIVSSQPRDLATAAAITISYGGEVFESTGGVLLVHVPLSALGELTASITSGVVRRPVPVAVRPDSTAAVRPRFGPTEGDQVAITNADAWHAAGYDGTGVRVGVIDFFDTKYWDTAEHGPLPTAGVDARCLENGVDCSADFFDGTDLGGEDHGVAIVEIIRDMAPGAEIFIGQASTISDYSQLIEWFDANGVSIISRSLGSRYDGPGDGRGPLDDVADDAIARGMLWVNSGGNNGDGRYYRHPVQLAGDRVAFGPDGSTTFLEFAGCVSLGGIRWANDWDRAPADRTDYDAFLWESPTGEPALGQVVASSTFDQRAGAAPLEYLVGSRCPRAGSSFYLELRWRGGAIAGDVIEVLDYGGGIVDFTQSEHSAAVSVVDSRSPGVVAVGAIDPPASGTIAPYSSQGPTNDGRVAPAVAAPSGFASEVFGTFSGTSASAAVVSGGAALLVDAAVAAGPTSLGNLVRHLTIDRGDAGRDNVFGHGEFRLPAPPDPGGVDDRPSRFVALDAPERILDTRPTSAVGPPELVGELAAGDIVDLPILGTAGIPTSGVTALVVNLAAVQADRPSYLQGLPTLMAELGGFSNVNIDDAAQTRANFAVIPVGADGSISIYSIAAGHVIVDVLGWFEVAGGSVGAGRFVELPAPERLLDSRTDAPVGPLGSGDRRPVPLPTSVDTDLVDALVVTVTAAATTDAGWVQAYPTDRPDIIASTSTINTTAGSVVANTAIVPIGSSGLSLTGMFANDGRTHVIVDAIGYITSSSATASETGLFRPVRPGRALDTRVSPGILGDADTVVVDASDVADLTVPDTAGGVVWNLTVTAPTRPGYARAWAADSPEPATSSLNWSQPSETRAAAAISSVDDGRIRVRVEDGTADAPGPLAHVLADVFGYFT